MTSIRWLVCFSLTASFPLACRASELYSTDFESFAVGDNCWAKNGWLSNDMTSGSQGIIEDHVADLPLGKTAYLGFEQPLSNLTTVAHPINYDPALTGIPQLRFESFLGIQDSTNGHRDHFFISFYNKAGDFLAAIELDNSSPQAEIARWSGGPDGLLKGEYTGVQFVRGDQFLGIVSLQILTVKIDLRENTWGALLDGIPLFYGAPFTSEAFGPLTIGSIAAEWELSGPTPKEAGDNWLLVTDWTVRAYPVGVYHFQIESISRNADGLIELKWMVEPGFVYEVEISADLEKWESCSEPVLIQNSLPTAQSHKHVDKCSDASRMFYRIKRSPCP